MANGDDKLNKVFQANPDGQYNLSHLGNSSDSSDSNNEQEESKETPKVDQCHVANHVNKTNHVFKANPGGRYNLTLLGHLLILPQVMNQVTIHLPSQMMPTQMMFPLSLRKLMINPSK